MLDRTRTIVTIRVFREELRWALMAARQVEFERSGVLAEAFADACHINGLSEVEVWEAIEADRSLAELMEETLREVVLGTPDPGPYDVISRESPSGTPENLHFGAYGAEAVGAKVTIKGTARG